MVLFSTKGVLPEYQAFCKTNYLNRVKAAKVPDARRQGATSEVYKHTPQGGANEGNAAAGALMVDQGEEAFNLGETVSHLLML